MDEVVEWLNGLKLDRLLPVFKDAELETMDDILGLTTDVMKEIGVKPGPRIRLLKAIKAHKVWFVYCCCLSLKNFPYFAGKPSFSATDVSTSNTRIYDEPTGGTALQRRHHSAEGFQQPDLGVEYREESQSG